MATAAPIHTHTPEELLNISEGPIPELVRGELREREVGEEADLIGTSIVRIVGTFVHEHKLGRVLGPHCGYQIFPHDPNQVRLPDVSFTTSRQPPVKGHSRTVPDLIVEVISPGDKAADLIEKLEDYHTAGVPLIWIVDPATRSVRVERGDGTGQWLRGEDAIEGGEALPGFRCPIRAFFES